MKPFIKWVGGKTQLLDEIRATYPERVNRYCEPFVGGGAVLFDVLSRFSPKDVRINDINPALVNVYRQLRDNCEEVIDILSVYQSNYYSKNVSDKSDYYYAHRESYNKFLERNIYNAITAALFLFLNKTCFNGLYRVNKKGQFNVPAGSYDKPLICDAEHLAYAGQLLQNVEITCGSYIDCEGFVDGGTFVYIDPPYRPLTKTSAFTSYASSSFNDENQKELKLFVDRLSSKGARVVVSNSDPKNSDINDNFFDDLYSSYNINRVSASRAINCKSSARGAVSELLICNF